MLCSQKWEWGWGNLKTGWIHSHFRFGEDWVRPSCYRNPTPLFDNMGRFLTKNKGLWLRERYPSFLLLWLLWGGHPCTVERGRDHWSKRTSYCFETWGQGGSRAAEIWDPVLKGVCYPWFFPCSPSSPWKNWGRTQEVTPVDHWYLLVNSSLNSSCKHCSSVGKQSWPQSPHKHNKQPIASLVPGKGFPNRTDLFLQARGSPAKLFQESFC